jgi:hypothetical protein
MSLDGAALAKLQKGQPVRDHGAARARQTTDPTDPNTHTRALAQVKKQINSAGKSGGRGIVVQDVHAPVAVVMDRILDFAKYPKMVPNVAQCGNYATKRLKNVRACLVGGVGGVGFVCLLVLLACLLAFVPLAGAVRATTI